MTTPAAREGESGGAAAEPRTYPGGAEFAAYAKERYDAEEKRVADFRDWIRQLAAAIGVVVGLEVTGAIPLLRGSRPDWWLLVWAWPGLLVCTLIYQAVLLFLAVHRGYVPHFLPGPALPTAFAGRSSDGVSAEITWQYVLAQAALAALGKDLAHTLRSLALHFAGTLASFLLFVVVGVVLTASSPAAPGTGREEFGTGSGAGGLSRTLQQSDGRPIPTPSIRPPTQTPTPEQSSPTPQAPPSGRRGAQ